MAPRRRAVLAALLNAVVLAPAMIGSAARETGHGVGFFVLVSIFAWIEAANSSDHDISTGRASRGPLFTGVALLVLFNVALLTARARPPTTFVIVGAVAMLAGIALRRSAMRALGPAFVSELRPLASRDRVRHGPYAWLEHPSELGLLAIAIGAALVLGSWPAAILWTIGLAPLIFVRMRDESRALREKLS